MASREEKTSTPTSIAGNLIKTAVRTGSAPDRVCPQDLALHELEPTPPQGRRQDSRSGFTLVEIVVVVVLISLFMVLSIPMFGQVGDGNLKSSALRLSGTIKYLFNESALTGLEYRLIFDLDGGTYRAQILEPDGQLVDAVDQGRQAALKGPVRFEDLHLPGRGHFSMGQVTTRIDPSGWIEETIIHLDDGDGEKLTLRVMPLTGTTEIFQGYREF